MKINLILVTLIWAVGDSFLAQASEPEQTPDVIQIPEPDETDSPRQALDLPTIPDTMDPGEKALFQSAYEGRLADVEVLVAKGTSVNSADRDKRTPLIMAAYNGHTSVVEFLYGQGADINHMDGDGKTALIYTTKRSFNETAAFLLKNGAKVNVQSRKKGVSALMIAAVADNTELVSMLLEHGADASLTDVFGRTASDLAQKKGNAAMVALLSEPARPAEAP